MEKFLPAVFIITLILSPLLSQNSWAIEFDEILPLGGEQIRILPSDPLEYKNWTIELAVDNSITSVSTNGDIIQGDKLRYFIKNDGECNAVGEYYSFITQKDFFDPKVLDGKKIWVNINGFVMLSEIITITKVSKNIHIALMYNGTYNLDEHAKFLEDMKKLDIELFALYKDNGNYIDTIAGEFFDVKSNSWSLENIENALMKGREFCLKNSVQME
jgi:hypothetical protein